MLLHQRNPNSLTAAVCCFIKVTALVETRETAGLRNLAQETILDLPDGQGLTLGERLSDLGLQATVQTSPDYVEAMFQGTGDQLPELLHAVRVVLRHERPAARQINLRRAEVLRQLEERRELPLPLARDKAQAHLYRNTSCSWPTVGAPTVASITADQLLALRQMRYVPNRSIVAVSGNISSEQCRQQAREALGDLLPMPVPAEPPAPPPAPARTALVYEPWRGDNAVVMIAAPFPSPEWPEFAAATVANAVLASGEGSRLFRALRDRLGLTYSVANDVSPSRICGMMAIGVTCEPNQVTEVFRIMQSEVATLKRCPPDESEVQRAQAYLTSSYVLGHQRNADVAHYLGLFEVLSPGRRESDLSAMVSAVTPDQVAAAANWLTDRSVWVQVGGRRP